MITTNRIEDKKPSGLMLPPMGCILTRNCYRTRDQSLGKTNHTTKYPLNLVNACGEEESGVIMQINASTGKSNSNKGAYLLRDKIAFVRFWISNLETTLEDIQVRHQLYIKDLLKPTS
ncbi:hypothetical protein Tco_1440724 [Tanacetum coccineum]